MQDANQKYVKEVDNIITELEDAANALEDVITSSDNMQANRDAYSKLQNGYEMEDLFDSIYDFSQVFFDFVEALEEIEDEIGRREVQGKVEEEAEDLGKEVIGKLKEIEDFVYTQSKAETSESPTAGPIATLYAKTTELRRALYNLSLTSELDVIDMSIQ